MSLGEKLARRASLPPLPNPYRDEEPGYRQPDAIDPSGYSVGDPRDRGGDGEVSDGGAPWAPPRLPRAVRRLSEASYGDDTVHPVPGGALGEAGAAWTDQDYGPALGLTGNHAIRAVTLGDSEDYAPAHAWPAIPSVYAPVDDRPGVYPGYSGPSQHRFSDAPLEYTAGPGGRPDTKPRSDSEVYRDVYGPRMGERREDPGTA